MRRALLLLLSSVSWACSPATPPSTATNSSSPSSTNLANPSTPSAKQKKGEPDVKAEVGALDTKAVNKNFSSLLQSMERCQDDRRKQEPRLDFLAGNAKIEVRVSENGSVQSAVLIHSTIGDIATEACILDATKRLSWPKPEGGLIGIASNEFSLPMKADREATSWGAEKAESTLAKANSSLSSCKSGAQSASDLTIYVDTDGSVISAGASQPDPGSPKVASCLVKAVMGLKFPSPGSWPAKVTALVR